MAIIYLDNCCYNRPFDERTNVKNYLEREAVLLIMQMVYEGKISADTHRNGFPQQKQKQMDSIRSSGHQIIGSDVLAREMKMISNPEKRKDVEALYHAVISDVIEINEAIADRARKIMRQSSIRAFDSLHLASAETKADVLLTTDIKFMKAANRIGTKLKVQNPVSFILEVSENEQNHSFTKGQ